MNIIGRRTPSRHLELLLTSVSCSFVMWLIAGCGGGNGDGASSSNATTANSQSATPAAGAAGTATDAEDEAPTEVIAPLSLNIGGRSAVSTAQSEDATDSESLLEAMEPLKVLTGAWRATPQRANTGDTLEEPNWAWDFRTDPGKPALVMSTNDSPYFRSIRLSYDVEAGEFTMTVVDVDDQTRELRGNFENLPTEFQGDDRRMHVSYKLTLAEVAPADERDQWQIALNQQDNNRYLVELSRNRSSGFTRFDTINTQRQGTSFAQADDDYGDRTCIISGGLGTMQVSYEGKSYWVCCSGCQAAFNDDPEKWIARYEESQREEMMP